MAEQTEETTQVTKKNPLKEAQEILEAAQKTYAQTVLKGRGKILKQADAVTWQEECRKALVEKRYAQAVVEARRLGKQDPNKDDFMECK